MEIANTNDKPQRADVLLANANPQYSRASLAKLFDMGNITQNNQVIKPGTKIKPSEVFNADVSPLSKPADDIELPVIYEDENVIVVDKPTGVISHARGRYWDEPSVASFIRSRIKGLEGERAGIVHRLDRVTSGVMICAKNAETLSYLQKQFSNRTVKKHYKAIINGRLNPEQGIIDVPVGRNPREPNKFVTSPNGKPARTEFYTESTVGAYSLINLHPLTGRTHQLRLHLKYMGHPIVGDIIYGGTEAKRLMLHAVSLEITLPGGLRKVFSSQLPKEFNELMI